MILVYFGIKLHLKTRIRHLHKGILELHRSPALAEGVSA